MTEWWPEGSEVNDSIRGKQIRDLRPDQLVRLRQTMRSWAAVRHGYFDYHALRRALRKVLNNYP